MFIFLIVRTADADVGTHGVKHIPSCGPKLHMGLTGTFLDFGISEEKVHHRIFREEDVAAHISANFENRPSLTVSFPAGNTGAFMEFDPQANLEFEILDSVT